LVAVGKKEMSQDEATLSSEEIKPVTIAMRGISRTS